MGFNDIVHDSDGSPLLSHVNSPESESAAHRVLHSSGKVLAHPTYTNDGTAYGTTWYGTYKSDQSNPRWK